MEGTEAKAMGFRFTAGLLLLFALLGGAAQAATAGASKERSQITILLYVGPPVSAAALAIAEQQAAYIFRQAGIDITWMNCSAGRVTVADECHRSLGPAEFVVHVVAQGKTSTDFVYGLAFLAADGSGKYSDVFLNRIESMHQESGVSSPRLLGAVIAHEVGHLLMGSHAHASMGIMSPRWNQQDLRRVDMGSLRFGPEQAALMRARILNSQTRQHTLQIASGQE
jgi:predicted Zn-dependent protease